MVWSLSKDDDGLDSVLPLADDERFQVPSPQGFPPAPVPPTSGANAVLAPPPAEGSGSTSVVVDPTSQVPQPAAQISFRHPVEATLVLKGRRLDSIRAELKNKRVAQRRTGQRTFALWAGAGAAALCLGWGVGLALSPGAEKAQEAPGKQAAEEGSPRAIEEGARPQGETKAAPATASGRSPTSNSRPGSKDSSSDEPVSGRGPDSPTPEGEGVVFTLDDLPVE